jgi:AcrR family transcriptional regulator
MPSLDKGAGARDTHTGVGNNGLTEAGRARVAEIQRARIVAAMVETAAEHGLADATVARVVKRAGVSRRTYYELFEDREDCLLAAFDLGIAQASQCVLDTYDPDAKWAQRVRGAVVALLSFLDAEPGMGQLLVVGSLGAGQRAQERRRRCVTQMIAFVDEGRGESKAGSKLPPLTAEGIVGGALSIVHARLVAAQPTITAHSATRSSRATGQSTTPSSPTGDRSTTPSPGTGDRSTTRSSGVGGRQDDSLLGLAGSLVSMIVLPYLGPAAARRELERPVSRSHARVERTGGDPLRDLGMRLTYRTVRVLMSVAALGERGSHPSNREVGEAAGITDQGQISKLLARLERLGLVRNAGLGPGKGAPNAWALTPRGAQVERAMSAEGGAEETSE